MNEDYRKAREWAEEILAFPETAYPSQSMVAKVLLDLLPKQTMADVEWDDDTHHLTGATSPGGDVVMMWHDVDDSEQIICVDSAWYPVQLTPNGKQYKLVEATASDHPEVLTTVEDYEDAPLHTIVALKGYIPYVKRGVSVWANTYNSTFGNEEIANTSRQVLRWGRGA